MMVVAEKKTETMLTQTSREEAEEILINTLDPYEKREFIGFIRGAKLVKRLQERRKIS